MDPKLPPLPPLPSLFDTSELHDSIPNIISELNISPLEDRPQDPIIARLLIRRQQLPRPSRSGAHTDRTEINRTESAEDQPDLSQDADSWQYKPTSDAQTQLLSWDTIHPLNEVLASSASSYLSEQPLKLVDVARGSLARERMRYTLVMDSETLKDFFQYLLYGTSSQLFYWADEVQLFKTDPRVLSLSIEGLSRSATHLITARFLNIGSLLRRLEEFVLENRARKDAVLETHSVVHCIRVVTAYLRRITSDRLLSSRGLIADSVLYAESEAILDFLGHVCYRSMYSCIPYQALPQSQKALLDHVYLRSAHTVHSSPFRSLRAIAAYLLSETSSTWLDHVATALGMNNDGSEGRGKRDESAPIYHSWPSFVDQQSGLLIERGIKSLRLLHSGQPGHPACHSQLFDTMPTKLEWVWTQKGVQDAVNCLASRLDLLQKCILHEKVDGGSVNTSAPQGQTTFHNPELPKAFSTSQPSLNSITYAAELSGMATFDRQPGHYADDTVLGQAVESLAVMVGSFPNALPSAAPTVDRLGRLVIVEPLVAHSRLLSQSLLDVFLNELHLLSHLDILYRFMLFGDPKFVANLREALCDERPFSSQSDDSSETESPTEGANLGLGLNSKLSLTGEWPPSGFGLSHSLRSVIVEVLEMDSGVEQGESVGRRVVKQEAEWRMGFVVPPVDDNDERERYHPSGLQQHHRFSALGFLRLQYRPPDALTSFLNPDVLEKYQRIFDFLLEMLRVDSVLRAAFQTTFREQKLSLHQGWRILAFPLIRQMESFLNGFLGYIFDTAISTNWKGFIRQVGSLNRFRPPGHVWSELPGSADDGPTPHDHDVFAVMQSHSDLLDQILVACFLKGRQKATRSAVQKPMLLILRLAQILQGLGRTEINDLAIKLSELQSEWNMAMHSMTKTLGSRDKSTAYSERPTGLQRQAISSNSNYAEELLLRIDLTSWYSEKGRASRMF